MHGQRTSLRIALCVIVMVAAGVVALAWWKLSLMTMALLAFVLACLAAIIYTWMTGRRVDRLLDKRDAAPAGADDSNTIAGVGHDQGMNHVE